MEFVYLYVPEADPTTSELSTTTQASYTVG
jgi:hypothetical protein